MDYYLSDMSNSFMVICRDSLSDLKGKQLLPIRWSVLTLYYYKLPYHLSDFLVLVTDNLERCFNFCVPLPSARAQLHLNF